ncbi:unnamed protein product, partial [Tetraodon nigroviridis]
WEPCCLATGALPGSRNANRAHCCRISSYVRSLLGSGRFSAGVPGVSGAQHAFVFQPVLAGQNEQGWDDVHTQTRRVSVSPQSAAAAPSPVMGNMPPNDGMPGGPMPPGFFQCLLWLKCSPSNWVINTGDPAVIGRGPGREGPEQRRDGGGQRRAGQNGPVAAGRQRQVHLSNKRHTNPSVLTCVSALHVERQGPPGSQPSPHTQPPPHNPSNPMMGPHGQPFMSPRYPGGPRPSLRMPNQPPGSIPGSQPLLPNSLDPTRPQGTDADALPSPLSGPTLTPASALLSSRLRSSEHGRSDENEPPQRHGRHGPTELRRRHEASSQLHGSRDARHEHGSRWERSLAKPQRQLDSVFVFISRQLCGTSHSRWFPGSEAFERAAPPSKCAQHSFVFLSVSPPPQGPPGGGGPPGTPIMPSPGDSTNSSENIYTMMNPIGPGGNRPNFPMGPGPDGPMGGMGGMEQHHMNGSLGSGDMDGLPKNSPNNMAGMNNPPGTPRDDGEMAGNFLNPFQSESVST